MRTTIFAALAAALSACSPPEQCTVVDTEEGATITCPDGTSAVISDGAPGAPGVDGRDGTDAAPCTFGELINGTRELSCAGTSAILNVDEEVTCAGDFSFGGGGAQGSVEALRGCDVIDGDLRIGGDVFTLRGLEGLRVVTGSFVLSSLSGNLTSTEEVFSLEQVGVLVVTSNQSLASLALPSLRAITGHTNGSGAVSIFDNAVLAELALPSIETIDVNEGFINILNNPLLPSCEVAAVLAAAGETCDDCSGNDDAATCE